MLENPYINVLIVAVLTVALIVSASYGLGFLARSIVRARGATPKQQESAFAGYFFAAPWIVGFIIFVVVPLSYAEPLGGRFSLAKISWRTILTRLRFGCMRVTAEYL